MKTIAYYFIFQFFRLCDWICDQAEECKWPYLWINMVVACIVAVLFFAGREAYYKLLH